MEEEYKPFYRTRYYVRDYRSKQEVAFLQMQGGISFQKRYMALVIPGKEGFHWENRSSRVIKLFESKTWNSFSAYLGNGDEELIINGKIIYPTFTTKKVIQLPLTGEIKTNPETNMLLLICGLYLLEQQISLKDFD